jgi:hypothetical protein
MRYFKVLIAALTIMACSHVKATPGEGTMMQSATPIGTNTHQTSVAATKEFLLRSASADFHAHPPAETLHFHNVRLGYVMTSEGKKKYMLCGEFLSNPDNGHGERAFFMTIDSPGGPNGYDQLLGGKVISLCDDPSVTWSSAGDLSSSLQRRFDSPKK